jgi:hypothetical protein
MSYTLTSYDDGQIIVLTLHQGFDLANGMRAVSAECFDMLEQGPERVILISDTRALNINNLNDLIVGANVARQPEAIRVLKHPKTAKIVSVISSRVVQMAVRGLNSASFGHVEVPIFETLEEALDHARTILNGARA